MEPDRLLAYDHWANQQSLRAMRALPHPHPATKVFGHIVAIQEFWLARATTRPDLNLDADFEAWSNLTISPISYRTGKGAPGHEHLPRGRPRTPRPRSPSPAKPASNRPEERPQSS